MDNIKISIITINFNNKSGLEETLKSVRRQTCKDFEHIVIDGGSTDGSKEVIEKYASNITYWVSESDKGVYNAMNKGVAAAKGEYCLFVNSGDKLYSTDTIAQIVSQKLNTDIIVGGVENCYHNSISKIWWPYSEDKISFVTLRDSPIHHPGALIRRTLQKEIPYNESLKICADRQFFMDALILRNCSYSTINVIINSFAIAGLSGSNNDENMRQEDLAIQSLLLPVRLLRDIECTNSLIQNTTRLMMQHHRFTKMLCRLNNIILKLSKNISKK